MKPRPAHQRRQAHRQRLALGRALHQVRRFRTISWRQRRAKGLRIPPIRHHLAVPRIVRKHERLLRRIFAVLGS